MPPILVQIPDEEFSFLSFPEGTRRRDLRIYIATQHAEQFPRLAEKVGKELENRRSLTKELTALRREPEAIGVEEPMILGPGFLSQGALEQAEARKFQFKAQTGQALGGIIRGAAGVVLDTDVANEELGERLTRFLQGSGVFNLPTLPEGLSFIQTKFQELFGNPTIPGTDTHIFPNAPAFVDSSTGDFDNGSAFRPVNLQGAMRAGLRQGIVGKIGEASADALWPVEKFGGPFEEFVPDGQLERTAFALAGVYGSLPELYVGGRLGKGVATKAGSVFRAGQLGQQTLNNLGVWMGALGFAQFAGRVTDDAIDFGVPSDLNETLERVGGAILEGSKGLLTGASVVAAQGVAARILLKGAGAPASMLPPSRLRAIAAESGVKVIAPAFAFGTVPPILDGVWPTIEGYVDALAIMAAFGIGENILQGQLRRQMERGQRPDVEKAVDDLLTELGLRNRTLPPLQLPPPRSSITAINTFRGGGREGLIPESRRLPAPDPSTISEGPGFVMQGRQEGQIAPAEAPVKRPGVPRAFEEQVEGSNLEAIRRVQQTEEAQKASDFADQIQELQKVPDLQKFLPSPDVDFTLPGMEPTQPVAGPVKRPALGVTGDVAPAPIGRNEAAFEALEVLRQRRVAAEEEFQRGFDEGIEGIATVAERLRPYRDYQQANDLARKRGPEEAPIDVEALPVEAGKPIKVLEHKIGDEVSIMGKDSILADQRVSDEGVRFELYNDKKLRDKGGAFRMVDVESGQTVTVQSFRTFDQAETAFKKAMEFGVPTPERGAQIEFDIEGIRRDARSDAEALDALVRDLAVIEGKETPEAIFEATARVSELSGEAISLREAEARNIARQIADSDLVAPGESITAVLGIDEAAQSIRVRLRDNTGDVETLDMPIGVIKGVPELIEAHRRAEASIEAAVEGRRVEAKESGALDRVRQRLMSELERLKNEELGAFRNPFSRKSTKPKTEADEYVAPYIEQTSRARLFEELSKINKARDTTEQILRKPDLTKKQRAKTEMLSALLREQQIKFAQAANAAPFVVVDPRAELNARPFNAVRAIAKRERISVGKHPTKSDLIEEIIVRRSRVQGQLSSPISGIDLAKSAEKKLNDELMARDERLDALGKRALDFVGRNINPTHTILDGLKQLRREHPDQYLPLIERAYVETELIRTAPSTGFEIYRKRIKTVYGQLSRSEKVLFDKMFRARADIALKEIDPAIQGTLEVMEAKKYLEAHSRQDPAAFSKISARIDLMRDLYKDGLEAAVEEGIVSAEKAENLRKNRAYLPVQYQELTDSQITGLGRGEVPIPSVMRGRKGGFEIDLPNLSTMNLVELRGFARSQNITGRLDKLNSKQLIDLIQKVTTSREARILDTEFLAERYFRKLGRDIQVQRAMQAYDELLTALPNNGIVLRRAEMVRDSKGRVRFAELDQGATQEILPFYVKGELQGLVVSKPFADAFRLRTQGSEGQKTFVRHLNVATLARFRKFFFTAAGAPFFWLVAGPRDFFQLGFSKSSPFRDPTYTSFVPGVVAGKVARDMARVAPDVFLDGPRTREFLENGGSLLFMARAQNIELPIETPGFIRSAIRRFESKETDSTLMWAMQNTSSLSRKAAQGIDRAFAYLNERVEILGRVAEMTRVKEQIAAEKGIDVKDLSASDIRVATYAGIGRMDLSARTTLTSFVDAFELYSTARVAAARSVGRMARDRPDQTAIRAMTMLTFGAALYGINKRNNEQATKDMPSYLKRDITFVLPDGLGTFDDGSGRRFSLLRIPVDQEQAVFLAFGYELGALLSGDDVDVDALAGAATQILKFRGPSSIGFTGQLFIEQFTNRSLVYQDQALFKGREGGRPGSEFDPKRTSPGAARVGRMLPFISPDRLQASIDTGLGESVGMQLLGNAVNAVSFIPDLRPDEKKLFLEKAPGFVRAPFGRMVKEFPESGAGFRNQDEIDRLMITEDNEFRTLIESTFLRAKARNNGLLVKDSDLEAEMSNIELPRHQELAQTLFESQMLRQEVVANTRFPRIWNSVLNADADVAGPRYFNFLNGLTSENRLLLQEEAQLIVRAKIRATGLTQWMKTFGTFVNEGQPKFDELERNGMLGDLTEMLEETLRETGRLSPIAQ